MALGFGFNKAKVLASAEKFVQQGKLQNAITEYEKVVREDPKDLTVLNTIGDLYARVGQNEHAIHYFKKVGDQYAQNGFTVKAIAIYKKLSKLSPNNAEHITKLAELYSQQGLYSDARAQYMMMADAHLRAGEHSQAARVFQRILELDPENTATQAKLADLYMKLGKREDALKIYTSAAEALYARNSYDAAAEALGKVLTLDPHNSGASLLRGMIAVQTGDSLAAVHHLEQVPELESRPDALRALLRARLHSGKVEGADTVAQTLLARHNDPTGVSDLADWYVSHDQAGSAVALYQKNADKLFAGGSAALQETLYPLINKVRDNPEALDSLQRLLQRGGGEAQPSAEMLEVQAHAHAQRGEYAQARDLYKKLSEIEPENALHNQNYRQMLAKLGEDSATRILTPEEAAQAFMVEELDDGNVVVQQKYDPPTETAIEAALTDAELYVSYNVPSKAIAPLEAALPLAPKDITLNQRLASLYARAERYADAAKLCQNLCEIYRELGHSAEAAKYQEAARKYSVRAGTAPNVAAAMRNLEPLPARTPEPPIAAVPVMQVQPEPAAPESAPSVQEFSFDVPEHIHTEPEPVALAPQAIHTSSAAPEFDLSAPPVGVEPEPAETPEMDVSNEWEEMLSVEAEGQPSGGAAAEDETQKLEPELEPQMKASAQPVPLQADEREGGSQVCYRTDEKVQEIQFYISQHMLQAAKNALNELSEMEPDSPQVLELMAAISAAQSSPAAHAQEAAAAAALEQAPVDFLPPPFAAPAPQTSLGTRPAPAIPEAPIAPTPVPQLEPVLQFEEVAQPVRNVQPPAVQPEKVAAAAESTEDILTDFVHELETTDLKDFSPKPQVETPAPAQTPSPVIAASAAKSAPTHSARTNGAAHTGDAGTALADILSDLQEETAEAAEPEEDPETHYNLGIAFKEMGLLDEAIGELQKVCRAIDKGHGFSQPIQAYTWLAQCLSDKGAPEAAVRWYQKALQIPGLDDSSRCAIYYDLAAAYEAFGDNKSALANFMEVYGSNIDFRDVASRIKALKS